MRGELKMNEKKGELSSVGLKKGGRRGGEEKGEGRRGGDDTGDRREGEQAAHTQDWIPLLFSAPRPVNTSSTFLPVGHNFLLFVSLPLLWVNPKFISLVGSAGGLRHARSPCEAPSHGAEILIGFLLDLPLLHQFLCPPHPHQPPLVS